MDVGDPGAGRPRRIQLGVQLRDGVDPAGWDRISALVDLWHLEVGGPGAGIWAARLRERTELPIEGHLSADLDVAATLSVLRGAGVDLITLSDPYLFIDDVWRNGPLAGASGSAPGHMAVPWDQVDVLVLEEPPIRSGLAAAVAAAVRRRGHRGRPLIEAVAAEESLLTAALAGADIVTLRTDNTTELSASLRNLRTRLDTIWRSGP